MWGDRGARGPRRPLGVALLLAVFFAGGAPARGPVPAPQQPQAAGSTSSIELPLSSRIRVRVVGGRDVEVVVRCVPDESFETLARDFARAPDSAAALARRNGGGDLSPGRDVSIPLALLGNEYRYVALRNLFPDDRRENGDWIHVARSGRLATPDEGLWQVAEWFAGDGGKFREIARLNRLASPELTRGQSVRIPAGLLHASFARGKTSDDGAIEYGEDERGPFASYSLKAGEALYSAVVLRFTGRTDPDDVNAVAAELALRSGIRDVTDIPVGYRIRIPFDLLEPEFLPRDHPRRKESEAARAEMARELAAHPVRKVSGVLDGVLVILDPGHGGRDLGTVNHGIWEHDYVYDVACRLKESLEQSTSARVFMTLEDPIAGFKPSAGDRLAASRRGTLRTDPPFSAQEDGESSVAVNLRWYLANAELRKATREGASPDRVVFLSLHADSRHPSLRGVMVYVPGQRFRRGAQGEPRGDYLRFREVREAPTVRFSRREIVRSEAVSRQLAAEVVAAFRAEDLPVQRHKPVRDRVIRGRRTWLPAVLRGNAVPAKVLVEMVNLSNAQDAAILGSARDRDRLAHALVRALTSYFGEAQSGRSVSAGSAP